MKNLIKKLNNLNIFNTNTLDLNIKNFQFINYKLKQIKLGPSKVISNHLSIRGVFSKPKLLYPRIKKLKKFCSSVCITNINIAKSDDLVAAFKQTPTSIFEKN